MTDRLRALVFMLASTFSFALMGAQVKALAGVPLTVKVLFRNLVSLGVAFLLIRRSGVRAFGQSRNQVRLLLRSLFGLGGVALTFYALQYLSLADSSILMRLSPFWVTLFAALFLRERLNPVQVPLLLLALAGTLLVIRPQFSYEMIPALAGLLAGVFAGAAYTLLRALKGREEPATIVFYFSFVSVLVMLPFAIHARFCPDGMQLLLLLGTGLAAAAGQITITHAYRLARASEVSIYNYAGIVMGAGLGYLFWGEVPDHYSVCGGLLIVLAAWLGYRFNR